MQLEFTSLKELAAAAAAADVKLRNVYRNPL